MEALFQTWLYFGLLTCTFRTVGTIRGQNADFARTDQGSKLITTERLHGCLDDWNTRENVSLIKYRGGDPSEVIEMNGKVASWPFALAMLSEIHDYVN